MKQDQKERSTFSTMTDDLLRLADWLVNEGCTHVAAEATATLIQALHHVLLSATA
jgi:hypothetical protein